MAGAPETIRTALYDYLLGVGFAIGGQTACVVKGDPIESNRFSGAPVIYIGQASPRTDNGSTSNGYFFTIRIPIVFECASFGSEEEDATALGSVYDTFLGAMQARGCSGGFGSQGVLTFAMNDEDVTFLNSATVGKAVTIEFSCYESNV